MEVGIIIIFIRIRAARIYATMTTTTTTTMGNASTTILRCPASWNAARDAAQRRSSARNASSSNRWCRTGRVVTACASRPDGPGRASKDPADFDNDYDAIREMLMRQKSSFQPGIATTLNWFSELAFGARKNREKLQPSLDALASIYGRFLDLIPYRRQNGSLPNASRGIEDALRRFRSRRASAAGQRRRRHVEEFWLARGVRDGFATCAMENVLALAMDFENGTVRCETDEDAVECLELAKDAEALCGRVESVATICLCSVPEAVKMAYSFPEILLTPSSAIVSRLSALKLTISGCDAGVIFRHDAASFLRRDVADIKVAYKTLQDAFPRVNIARLVEYDPSLLLIDVDVGIKALRELWKEDEFAQSDVDNPFFAEELALALKTLSGHGPEQYGG